MTSEHSHPLVVNKECSHENKFSLQEKKKKKKET